MGEHGSESVLQKQYDTSSATMTDMPFIQKTRNAAFIIIIAPSQEKLLASRYISKGSNILVVSDGKLPGDNTAQVSRTVCVPFDVYAMFPGGPRRVNAIQQRHAPIGIPREQQEALYA